MIKIGVLGSEAFRSYTEVIEAKQLFHGVQLISIITEDSERDRVKIVQQIESGNFQVIVMGPVAYAHISPHINTPCYMACPGALDFLALHGKIKDYEKTAVIFRERDDMDFSLLEKALHVKYRKFYYHNLPDLDRLLLKLKADGYTTVISNYTPSTKARQLNMEAYDYFSREKLEDAIGNAIQIVKNLERESRYNAEIRSILENTMCGVIRASGPGTRISYVNKTALNILRQRWEDLYQRPLCNFIPEKIVNRILSQNEPENDIQLTLRGVDIIGNIVPLQDDDESICLLFENTSRILEYETMIRQEIKRKSFRTHYSFYDIIGRNSLLKDAIEQAKRFAVSNSTILINAETGAGKEVFAQSIHDYSPRRQYPFVAINCASIPDTLIESELFGYAPGSFTGASSKGKSGLVELANHGTVFLDDIDSLSPNFQAKLLRVLQEKEIIRIGGNSPVPVDVRFIVATNHNLKKMVEKGAFRNDLYFRLNVLRLQIPPLRSRPEDIPLLYEHYLSVFDAGLFQRIQGRFLRIFAPALAYDYPGNIRELISIAERFIALVDQTKIDDDVYLTELVRNCLDVEIEPASPAGEQLVLPVGKDYAGDLLNAENSLLQYYLQRNSGSMTQLAKQLKMSRTTLYNRLRELEAAPGGGRIQKHRSP